MTTADTREALERASEPRERTRIRDLIERMEPELVRSLQDPGAAQRLARHYLNAIRFNPLLGECSSESLLGALMLSAQVGLEPGPLGHVYLVPYGDQCTWILGYTGIIELARRSDRLAGLRSIILWNCDEYELPRDSQTGVKWSYEPGPENDRISREGLIVAWNEKSAGKWFPQAQHVPVSRVERARKASKAKAGPWVTDEDSMWRKTGVRAVRPWLPLSPAAGEALAHDGATVSDVTIVEETAQPVLTEAPE